MSENLDKIIVFLVSSNAELNSKYSSKEYFNFEFIVSGAIPELSKNPGNPKLTGDNLIFTRRNKNGDLSYLTHRPKPEKNFDWIEVAQSFAYNYYNLESENGFWRWGQIVPEDGSYLCRDCGFIGDFLAGEVFPICDVCLDGDPGGPIPLSEGYWELV